ncbi:MAG: hypothetical protein JW819_14040 [Candidatus Krumholzibacteriota bacterium]|nr:hypothetical protein [Candidatus Krumholzibacteriota bacterium]
MAPSIVRARLTGAALCLLLLVASLPAPAVAGRLVEKDGVIHVLNGSEPRDGRRTLALDEVWRVGGDAEESILLGLVTEVGGDADGNVYVMDTQLCQVHVFSPAGELLRTLFRQGEGPGEVYRPRDLVLLPDGVGLAEEFPGKITLVDYEGLPHGRIALDAGGESPAGIASLTAADCGGGNLVLSGTRSSRGDNPAIQKRVNFLARFDRDGAETVRYLEQRADYDFTDFTFSERVHTPSFWWGFTVGPDGRVYAAADRDRYAVSVFRADGALERVIERECRLRRRPADEIAAMRATYESALSNAGIPVTIEVSEADPAISFWQRPLRIDAAGRLWVLADGGLRDQPAGIFATWDVFDAEGHFAEQVSVACAGDPASDALFWMTEDRVVLVTGYTGALAAQFGRGSAVDADAEEATPQAVICFTVRR